MPIGHKRPSELFKEAVSTIERNRMTAHATKPVNAPMVTENKHVTGSEEKNERQGIEGERTTQEINVPIVDAGVVSAESGNSSSDWKVRIEAAKKAKRLATAPKIEELVIVIPVALEPEVAKEQ
jgi:hypothetical protein